MLKNNFSESFKKILIETENKVRNLNFKELKEEDILINIVSNSNWDLKDFFDTYWISKKLLLEIYDTANIITHFNDRKWVYSGMSKSLKDIILYTVKIATSFSKETAEEKDFIIALIEQKTFFIEILNYIWINVNEFVNQLRLINKNNETSMDEVADSLWEVLENIFWWDDKVTPFDWNIENKQKIDSNTPTLDFFTTNLVEQARNKELDKVIWREKEIERLIAILNRKTKNNPVLVWEPWVGKTAIIEWLAARIVNGSVPFSMKEKKILSLDMSTLVAWTKFRWEFEQRIKQIIDEASKIENEVILFIDEIHTIIWAWWAEWTLDASNILKPAMWRWKIRVIWATTLKEYEKYIEKDSALERRFQKITANEPDLKTAIEIVGWLKQTFEEYHNLNITDKAIEEAVDLSVRYITDRFLPDKAIDLIDEACSIKSMKYNVDEKEVKNLKEKISKIQKKIEDSVISQQYKKASTLKTELVELEKKVIEKKSKFNIPKDKRLNITEQDIQKVLSMSSSIPVEDLSKNDIEKLKKLPKKLKDQIIWQDEAIKWIINSIMRSKAWINNPDRPLWSFLFLWPTWVGKTELVKVIAKEFYSDEKSLIKIDMSEYSDKTWASKLIWANAWYVWYEEGWLLTEKVRKKPYSIVLFDEIEKWDFEIYNLLLQILEEWQLTDSKWRVINFRNTIIIMTSNIGHEEFAEKAAKIGFEIEKKEETKASEDFEKAAQNIKDNLTDYFSPEFINRIDKVIVFKPLDKKSIKKIVEIQLNWLAQRIEQKNIKLSWDKNVINYISKEVYNPSFWAREIRRYLNDNIEDEIANLLISWKINDTINLVINKKEKKIDIKI